MKPQRKNKQKSFTESESTNLTRTTTLSRIKALKPAPLEPEPIAYVLPHDFLERAKNSLITADKLGLREEWDAWFDMVGRCYMPDHPSYPKEGAIGVRVCLRWMRFENFMADMGLMPRNEATPRTVH